MPTRLATQPIAGAFFEEIADTRLAWLGSAGVLLNVRGTILLIDPVLTAVTVDGEPLAEGVGPKFKIPPPLAAWDVPRIDAVLITHADDDHFGRRTTDVLNRRLAPRFVGPGPVHRRLAEDYTVPAERLTLARDFESISIGSAQVLITPALHDWQSRAPYRRGDCCGYVVQSPDANIWHPGDTRLLNELLQIRKIDVLFFDVSEARAHLGPKDSARLAASCGAGDIIAYHYGTFDVPPGGPFGCDPADYRHITRKLAGRFRILNPGQVLRLPTRKAPQAPRETKESADAIRATGQDGHDGQ